MSEITIVLRPWRDTDATALLAIFASADDLRHQLPGPLRTAADATRMIESVLVCDDRARHLAVTIASDGEDPQPVGNVAVSHLESRHDTGWVSYFSAGWVRGRGLLKRAVTAVANWALTDPPAGLGVFRLELGHRLDNPASGAVAVAAGFVAEGVERKKLRYDGVRYDVQTYSRLATDPFPPVTAVTIA